MVASPVWFSKAALAHWEHPNEPTGAGLDLPDWLAALEDEVTTARSRFNHQPSSDRMAHHIGQVKLTWQELLE